MPVLPRRAYGSHGPPDPVPGFTWNAVEGTLGSQYQLPQYELTPVAGTTSTGTTGSAGVPSLPDYSQVDSLIAQINATNQAAQHAANLGRIPGAAGLEAQSSQNIAALLNPPEQFGEIDVPSAARAVESGTVGSPFAGVTGLNLSETERLRRQAMGQAQLSGAYARNPAAPIADPQAWLSLLTQLGFRARESALDRALQAGLAQLRQPRYGGGSSYGPRLPTDYGAAPTVSPAAFRAGIPELPSYGGGAGTGWLLPAGVAPENMFSLTGQQQMDYANAYLNNPYNAMPEVLNPYGAEYNPLDPTLAAYYE